MVMKTSPTVPPLTPIGVMPLTPPLIGKPSRGRKGATGICGSTPMGSLSLSKRAYSVSRS